MRHVNVLVHAGVIEDASKVWWDLRPSIRYPTLEMRISDLCTTLDDTICIAAMYQCWLKMLYRLRQDNKKWRIYSNMLIDENRWRAHRYGIDQGLIDFGLGEVVDYSVLLDEILGHIKQDATETGCLKEVRHSKKILKRGTSAHRQLQTYYKSLDSGKDHSQAIKDVVDWLRKETLRF